MSRLLPLVLATACLEAPLDAANTDRSFAVVVHDTETCSGLPGGQARDVAPPVPPSAALRVPVVPRSCIVGSVSALEDAVSAIGSCDVVVVAPGHYWMRSGWLQLGRPVRLWVAEPGSAVFHFGVAVGTHSGSELHGLTLDIPAAYLAVPGPVGPLGPVTYGIAWWNATDVEVADTRVDGNGVVDVGIAARGALGTRVARVEVSDTRDFAVNLRSPDTAGLETLGDAVLTDLDLHDVGTPHCQHDPFDTLAAFPTDEPPCPYPGTTQIGLWIGAPATVERVRVRDVYWGGIATGNSPYIVSDVVLRDVDVDRIGVGDGLGGAGQGITTEKYTRDLLLERFCVGPDVERGVHAEWDNLDDDAVTGGTVGLTVRDGALFSWWAGVYTDDGTGSVDVSDIDVFEAVCHSVSTYQTDDVSVSGVYRGPGVPPVSDRYYTVCE
jgi:hypothetical protein